MRILLCMLLCAATTQAQQVIQLYEARPPGSEAWHWNEAENNQNSWNTRIVYNVSQPSITAYLPKPVHASGTAVIIAPGGGFHALSMESEGTKVAEWLVSRGVAAFVLKYRTVHSLTTDPTTEMVTPPRSREEKDIERDSVLQMATQDALTALAYVRTHAAEFSVQTDRIGMIGFSAGGTLTMSAVYAATEINRPNFVAPIYAYTGSIKEHKIPEQKTPIFIAVAADDPLQLLPYSTDLFERWHEAKQAAELHVYHHGGHGFGMRVNHLNTDTWYMRFTDWMASLGLIRSELPDSEWARQWNERLRSDWSYQARYTLDNQLLMQQNQRKMRKKRIVLIGDSITEGWESQDPSFFAEQGFVGRGIGGQTSGQVLLRFRQDVVDLQPETVVINIGINDIAENNGPYNEDFTFGNIASMCEVAHANKIKVVLSSVLPASEFPWRRELGDPSQKVVALNARLRAYAAAHKHTWLDYHFAMRNEKNGLDKSLAEDGVHPTAKAYQMMARELLQVLKK
jgi:lysophospholipase L1-like esterase/acetyl esterase/lipase